MFTPPPFTAANPATTTDLLDALYAFACTPPDFDPEDWQGAEAELEEARAESARDRRACLKLVKQARKTPGLKPAHIFKAAQTAFSGRLSINPATLAVTYNAGQYYDAEYRAAVAAVLEKAMKLAEA